MILAIDPGSTESAYVSYEVEEKKILAFGKICNDEMLELVDRLFYDSVYIEMVASYGMPVGKEVFETCVWIGRFLQMADAPVRLVYRRDVKLHLCGNVRAKDSNIIQAVKDLYGGESCKGTKASPGPLHGIKADCWQALALAITAAETKDGK